MKIFLPTAVLFLVAVVPSAAVAQEGTARVDGAGDNEGRFLPNKGNVRVRKAKGDNLVRFVNHQNICGALYE